jgi:hypothetical protein
MWSILIKMPGVPNPTDVIFRFIAMRHPSALESLSTKAFIDVPIRRMIAIREDLSEKKAMGIQF